MKMKIKVLALLSFSCLVLLLSCNKEQITENQITNANDEKVDSKDTVNKGMVINKEENITISYLEDNNYITDYAWSVSDGRSREDRTISTYDWVGRMAPQVFFRKLNVPINSVIYQMQLRKEIFWYYYQTEEIEKIYQLKDTHSNNIFDINFNELFNILLITQNGKYHSRQNRIGEQMNQDHPLVGIWGELPNLSEYCLVDPAECLYYMEIDREIPFWAVRKGIYLLKQTRDNEFETITAFPEGKLKLEIKSDKQILLRPIFKLADDEEGLVDLLIMNRHFITIKEMEEDEEYYDYYFGD